MKTILLAFSILLAFPLFGQNDPNSGWIETLNFDSPYWDTFYVKLQIDTINSNNIWQVGSPQKTLFNQAVSLPNVIITDTVNTYPINDTSYFIINYSSYNCPLIQGSYYSDTDSLNDYGMIEISLDNGQTWIDALNDSTLTQSNKPNLTGNSGGWQHFFIDFWDYTQTSWQLNTFLVKFTFISDSIDAQHEGLMFDDLGFCILINTQNIKYQNNLTAFPNPTSDLLNF